MAYTIQLPPNCAQKLKFGYSIGQEILLSLHILQDHKHHPIHLDWVLESRNSIDSTLKKEIEQFRFLYARPLAVIWDIHPEPTDNTFENEMQTLSEMDIEQYVESCLRPLLKKNELFKHLNSIKKLELELYDRVNNRYPYSLKIVKELFEDPEQNRQRFMQFLNRYWNTVLKEKWSNIEERLIEDINLKKKMILKDGAFELLSQLSSEIHIKENENKMLIRRPSVADITLKENEMITIVPSYFMWPHLFIQLQNPFIMCYSVSDMQKEAKTPIPPQKIVNCYRVLGDEIRFQMIQLMAHKMRSTQELAMLLNLTEAAVSKHLKQLQECDLIIADRKSYYVFYRLNQELFHQLGSHTINIPNLYKN